MIKRIIDRICSHSLFNLNTILIPLLLIGTFSNALSNEGLDYPMTPDQELTPGSLCMRASELRYPEKIRYCERDVESETKKRIFALYDSTLGYKTQKIQRQKFKIDHYIPLCMGGSNEMDNLWPQHESVFQHTDPVEYIGCIKLAEGKITQARVIELVRQAKANPKMASGIENMLRKL